MGYENESNDKQLKILGIILTLACPLLPIGYFLYMLFDIFTSGGSDDAVGWAFVFLLCIGVALFSILGVLFLPLVFFCANYKKDTQNKKCQKCLIASDLLFSLEMYIIYSLTSYNDFSGRFSIYTTIWLIYTVVCVMVIFQMKSKE